MNLDKVIKRYLRVKRGDIPPYTGWLQSTRLDLAKIIALAGFKTGAEIGVCKARHAIQLFDTIPELHLYCVDSWMKYPVRNSQERQDRNYEKTVTRLKDRNATIIRKTSMDALPDIEDGSLDFVYIDGLHYFDYVMQDIIGWAQKVKIGGIISGHDYFQFYKSGVMEAVNAYTRAHGVFEWYLTREFAPSFFWVKKHND